MDRNKAHDVLHVWHGNRAETCPVCCGTIVQDEAILAAAKEVAAENYYPRINPTLNNPLYCDENGKLIEESQQQDAVKAGEKPTEPVTKKAEAKAEEAINKKTIAQNVKMSELSGRAIFSDVMSFSEDGSHLPKTIKIIPTGVFKTQAYGDVTITKNDLLEMADNFTKGVRAGVPIDIDHDQKAAAGWINKVMVYDDGMYAEVDWTPLGVDKLSSKEYRFFSPEFSPQYIDPEHSVEMSNVLIAGSLVNRPMFKELPAIAGSEDGGVEKLTKPKAPLMLFITNQNSSELPKNTQSNSVLTASEKEKPMDLQTILTKEKSARTSDEQAFVAANRDQLSDEQKASEGFVTPPVETKTETAPTITAGEQTSTSISASEVEALKLRLAAAEEAAQKGTLAFSELQESKKKIQKIEITESVKAFQFNEKGGKIAPAQVEPIVNLMITMSEPQRAELTKIIEALPDRKVFGEMGSDEDMSKSQAKDVLNAKIKELQGQGMTFSEASRKVVAENPGLYQESLQPASKSDL